MLIRDLFQSDVTRNIPPVVYFHEQSPDKLQQEVYEYIITGGWPDNHPNHRRVPKGVHEEYVRLLKAIRAALDAGEVGLPNIWISGFYGSGKSSFAKLLGLALDRKQLPDGRSLADALLARDTSPRSDELRQAWEALLQRIEPVSVVFDVGNAARNNEHVHVAVVRQVQAKLGYSTKSPHIAAGEMDVERDKRWHELLQASLDLLKRPWSELKDGTMAPAHFSRLMARLYPDAYRDDGRDWHTRHASVDNYGLSPQEAAEALAHMLAHRRPNGTLFLVIDEMSQYVLAHYDRAERLRAFAESLGAHLKGKVWLCALGQQRLDDAAEDSFLIKTKDRFPPHLRVHLAPTNIRDVVHKRLLAKRPEAEPALRALFAQHRPDLKLYAYRCENITEEEFLDAYPLVPAQLDLILQITTALRTRSARAQGDAQAIRGLLQLLGELFRAQKLADKELGHLVTLDQIYEVQHTALDADLQSSMARLLAECSHDEDPLLIRAAKAVALLELIQESEPTTDKLVAQCLYERLDQGNLLHAVTEALEELRRRNLLSYSEKTGYKLQSLAGEVWERERRELGSTREAIVGAVQEALRRAMADPKRPVLEGRAFPWAAVFSDAHHAQDVALLDPREEAVVRVDFRLLGIEEQAEAAWIKKSAEHLFEHRLVWVASFDAVEEAARELLRSQQMVQKYHPRRNSLPGHQLSLLHNEETRAEELQRKFQEKVEHAWAAGKMYFRGAMLSQVAVGSSFDATVMDAAGAILPRLYPNFRSITVTPTELEQLLLPSLSGPSLKFLSGELGILALDAGNYSPACNGAIPRSVQAYIETQGGVSGTALLGHFSGPPYAYPPNVVIACVAGLLRASKVRIQPEGGQSITAINGPGVRDVLTRERDFRRANFFTFQSDLKAQDINRICKTLEETLKDTLRQPLMRDETAIADCVSLQFPPLAQRLRSVRDRLLRLPTPPALPPALDKLGALLDQAVSACRQTRPTVLLLKQNLDPLRDGIALLHIYDAELTPEALAAVAAAHAVLAVHAAQLQAIGVSSTNLQDAIARLAQHLALERPWRDIAALSPDLKALRDAYHAERERLLSRQEEEAQLVRARLRHRSGFGLLTADQSSLVLKPISDALDNSAPTSTSPSLLDLKDPFALRLQRAEQEAHAILDELQSDKDRRPFTRVALSLANREVSSEEQLDALLNEIRDNILPALRDNKRVRLS